jgi:hypothetical protein
MPLKIIGSLISAVFAIILFTGNVYAHGTAIYVSTPVSAPRDFGWVVWVSVFILIVAHAVLLNKFMRVSWLLAIPCSLIAVTIFGLAFYCYGRLTEKMTSIPLPALEWGKPVFGGFGWRAVGFIFCGWNLFGIGFLAACIFITCRILITFGGSKIRERWPLYALSAGAYILCLCPYIFSGALSSGWHGGYMKGACVRRICDLGIGLRKYADDHGGRLPIGKNLSEIMPQLRPYVWSGLRYKMPIHECPLEGSYEKEPKPYVWNPQMSGKSLDELSQQKPEKLLWCPYQHGSPMLYTYHILNKEPQRLQKGVVFPIEEIMGGANEPAAKKSRAGD